MKMPDEETRRWIAERLAGLLILTGISLYLVTFIQVHQNMEVLNQAGNVTWVVEGSEESKEAVSLGIGEFLAYSMFYKPLTYSIIGGGIIYVLIPLFVSPIFSGAKKFLLRVIRRLRE